MPAAQPFSSAESGSSLRSFGLRWRDLLPACRRHPFRAHVSRARPFPPFVLSLPFQARREIGVQYTPGRIAVLPGSAWIAVRRAKSALPHRVFVIEEVALSAGLHVPNMERTREHVAPEFEARGTR